MQESTPATHTSQLTAPGVAFLWDESFIWGLMAYRALKGLGLPFDLIKAEDIKTGALNEYKMLFVPGGWASNKSKALGDSGLKAIRGFVENGGNYLGFCGGAGLATEAKGGIGLLNVRRRPTRERVPSFSGRIGLHLNEHPIWNGITAGGSDQRSVFSKKPTAGPRPPVQVDSGLPPVFHAWWPSQFIVEDNRVKTLAAYNAVLPARNTYTRQILESAFAKTGQQIHTNLSTNYLETIKMLVAVGLGWGILPRTMLTREILVVKIPRLHLLRKLGIVWHPKRTLSNAAKVMMELLDEEQRQSGNR